MERDSTRRNPRISVPEHEARRIRTIAWIASITAHVVLFSALIVLRIFNNESTVQQIDSFGGSGGGGGEGKEYSLEFGPTSDEPENNDAPLLTERFHVVKLQIHRTADEGMPVLEKNTIEQKSGKKKSSGITGASPTRRKRGVGKGSDGGTGGGKGGGIGKGSGYSIDWGGTNSRKLLSGRLPHYPEGTDKEMAVSLQFSVMPDGSVINIIPLQRADEILEREAIAALQSWRFDPLPAQFEQRMQTGKIIFNFKLE